MNKFVLIICIFFILNQLKSQTDAGFHPIQYNYTEDVVYVEDFSGAIRLYKEMINFDPKNPAFYYRLGFAFLNTFNKQDSAIVYLKKSIQLYNKNYRKEMSPTEAKFYLARAYRLNNQIDSSLIILYELRRTTNDSLFLVNLQKEIHITENTCKLKENLKDLPPTINTKFTEHSPVLMSNNKIILFTSRRNNQISMLLSDNQWAENIYISQKVDTIWTEAQIVSELSSIGNDATCFATYDQKHLLIYKDDEAGSIYITTYENEKWTQPQKLPRPINSIFRETHASMTPNMDTIFFTSNRPGGYGGLDIWMSIKDSTGKWQKPKNLGPNVNTSRDEESPNISRDGRTLYFSSNGRGGFGGFDIFRTQINEFGFATLTENLGYPINSADDDLFYVDYSNDNIALFASYRADTARNADLFIFNLDTSNVNKKIINYGFVYDDNENPINNIEIHIKNIKFQKQYIARTTAKGKFVFITEPNNQYEIFISKDNQIVYYDKIYVSENTSSTMFYKNIKINDKQ